MNNQATDAQTKRYIQELASPAGKNEIQVFDLRNQQGNFESSGEGFRVGTRSFGLWSFLTPKKGDLVVIQRGQQRAAYLITSVDYSKTFTGSDSNKFWNGMMDNIANNNLGTAEIERALKAAIG